MKLAGLSGKHVAILGYAREGRAMHSALAKLAGTQVTICDANPPGILEAPANVSSGPHYLDGLKGCDVIIKSSGVPDLPELLPYQNRITNQMQIFFDSIAGSGVTTVGITGSKGKSTTANLIYLALKAGGKNAHIMGNFGIPVIGFVEDAKRGAIFVVELSSFQLQHLTVSPNIAIITSFFPEHLDRHGSVESYWNSKRSITAHQTANDIVFFNSAYPQCRQLANLSPGRKVAYQAADFPLEVSATKLLGEHNKANLAAGFLVATHLGVPEKIALEAECSTPPLPHRLQLVASAGGINWINDSIATNPQATLAALKALGEENVQTLLLGGHDRGLDYAELARHLAESPFVKNIVLFPETGPEIKQLIEDLQPAHPKKYHLTTDMSGAVMWAAKHTEPGKTCLLSCAAPSFNLYKDFVERGEAFEAAVKKSLL